MTTKKFQKILIANRGEIAVRVIRACREMGIASVAVYAADDRAGLHVRLADEAYALGEGSLRETYLNGDLLRQIAIQAGAQAIHPGYGFLSENADFARSCGTDGLVFIGPKPEVIAAMGLKVQARQIMADAGVPVVPGSAEAVTTSAEVSAFAQQYGYPVAVKASAGGGGKGLRVVTGAAGIKEALEGAQREAQAYFGNPAVYLEKYLPAPRHVEVQVFGDQHGHLVHLGERDCSLQRRHQKVMEEAPAPYLPAEVRQRLCEAALKGAGAIGYSNAGTLEFLVQGNDFYFLEVNTRLQVEHPVTEMVTGLDLVKAQIKVAAGEPLPWRQEDICWRGHALECRINAEDAARNFRPASGRVTAYETPGGPGVRVDGAAYAEWLLPSTYDSLIAKLVTWGEDRQEAWERMQRALAEYRIEGIVTNIPFHQWSMAQPALREGRYDTGFLAREFQASTLTAASPADDSPENLPTTRSFAVEVNRRLFQVQVRDLDQPAAAVPAGNPHATAPRRSRVGRKAAAGQGDKVIRAPLSGSIVRIHAQPGDQVTAGAALMVLEAMKMENDIPAPASGKIKELAVAVGDRVAAGAVLAVLE